MKQLLLGEIPLKKKPSDFKKILSSFEGKIFEELPELKKNEAVHRALLEWIQKQPQPCFLLPEVLDFIREIDEKKILTSYSFLDFELWLNQLSHLSFEENYQIRGKIAGKSIDRSDYQILFPIGMGKIYEGTHFVTAHKSPDLDTTIASFWGWLDAFAARVSHGLHVWNLPGGPPPSQIEIEWLFKDCFGEAVFTHLPKNRNALHVTATDLMTQKGMLEKPLQDSIASIDHERDQNSVVVVDKEGAYLGDWRSVDVEGVRQVIILLSGCLRWFENNTHLQLVSLFARPSLSFKEISPPLQELFHLPLENCEPAHEFSKKQKLLVHEFLVRILHLKEGLQATFAQLAKPLISFAKLPYSGIEDLIEALKALFDAKGKLREDRPHIFHFLEKIVKGLHESIVAIRGRLETLDIAIKTKYEVFGNHHHYVTQRTDVEEIKDKMGTRLSLTVLTSDQGKKHPLGIVPASELRKPILATASLRDFCNRDEMGIPSYIDVISVIDHHKSSLSTFSPPLAIIADAQSSNSLVARAAFEINDRIKKRKKGSHFVDPKREFLEYLHFLYGILDDTDLLSKVSAIDLECMVSLLNRLKTLSLGKETEIVTLDDLERDSSYLKKGARRLLQNKDLYSLYQKVYTYRESEVEQNILLSARGKPSNLFADTKEQNGCCRIGQTKIFAKNVPVFQKSSGAIRQFWLENAKKIYGQNREINLHIHMISTITSADEVYKGAEETHPHRDEMWIWAPLEESGIERLRRFLTQFQSSPGLKGNVLDLEFSGKNGAEFAQIFQESFIELPRKISKGPFEGVLIRYKAGSMNSRKAMVSPFLPSVS